MHVGVEIASLDRLLQKAVDQTVGNIVEVMARGDQLVTARNFYPAHPVERQHPTRCPVPVNVRNFEPLYIGRMLREFRSRSSLAAQVKLTHRPAAEIGDN